MPLLDIFGDRYEVVGLQQDNREDGSRLRIELADNAVYEDHHGGVRPCWLRMHDVRWYWHGMVTAIECHFYKPRTILEMMTVGKVYTKVYDNVPQAIRKQYRAVSGELVQRL